jgi:hypothetical protein
MGRKSPKNLVIIRYFGIIGKLLDSPDPADDHPFT